MIIHHGGAGMRQLDQIRDACRLLPKDAEVFTHRTHLLLGRIVGIPETGRLAFGDRVTFPVTRLPVN